ncbi:unnamed protein product [Caenorhabditis auriculariae]|uniref:Uncharacterized protein n=1 Tax=Caenorhabditis auriculariae TaxID=2777116 RepID=A0A8S1HVV0_9PELO|nr:unnamed protein product [Caenorhabditis auriculariae]
MPYYGQGNRTPMEKARGLLIAEIDRKNEIIKYLEMDMFDKKRMFIGNIETEENIRIKTLRGREGTKSSQLQNGA